MYNLYKHNFKTVKWDFVKEFKTFNEAKQYAEKHICLITYSEGEPHSTYWFADNNNADTAFKGYIEKN